MDITVEDIREWARQLDESELKPRIKEGFPIIEVHGDRVHFLGPNLYGSCSREQWEGMMLAQGYLVPPIDKPVL